MRRTGNEPNSARSPLRLRLGLALTGLVSSTIAAVVLAGRESTAIVLVFAAVAVSAAVDLLVVVRRIRQGPHFQPGSQVPPYPPVDPPPRPPRERRPVDEGTRVRRYLLIMGTCVLLVIAAWTVVRPISTGAAVVMGIVAAVLPPVAVFVAGLGANLSGGGTGPGWQRRPRDGGLGN
ncbi:hypothetical protein GCM10022223_40040 [Kineosporia mesophila]|uniref:Uncharacterized protein n=1 Tax=Kineosporia mesophila TaxID=566012 RepID=A0ABP6ZZF2_9ACTN|nr:DUF6343 family protein [Kineosporia mesophila]MCD5348623.1 DUF6343 family protein [Kineosporia mesophila]